MGSGGVGAGITYYEEINFLGGIDSENHLPHHIFCQVQTFVVGLGFDSMFW